MNAPDPIASSRARRQFQRAEAYLAGGDAAAAAVAFEATLKEQPGHVPALLKLSALHLMAGRYTPAFELTLRAAQQAIESPGIALQLIGQVVALGHSRMVIDICSQLPPAMWDSANSLATVAQQLSRVGANRQARAYSQAAVQKDPRHPPSLYMAANIEVFFGEIDAAADLLERALAIHPDLVDAHWLLSRLRRPNAAPRIARIENALTRVPPGEDEAFLAYALHNELHDARDYPRAWAALERACRAKRSRLNYDPANNRELFARLHEWTAAEIAAAQGTEQRALTPIFVVGMHRSGTTLVERILGGHSQVSAAGETYELPTQLRAASGLYRQSVTDTAFVAERAKLDYRKIGTNYLAGMHWRARERAFVTDKLPSNFLNIGFIAQALPHARIVHVCRDPIDIGLSNLRTLFTTACPYSYDQHEFIEYYRLHERLMQHWRALLPDRILDVHYQDVIADPAGQARRMAQFCGLPFEPAMVAIERSNDPVATASSVLLRDGIRSDRSRLWSSYAEQMRPMVEAFS
ncbi:MAG TPA: sulfotransferase [Xanthomonadales bacterium]|nr:sulfotransferase [Xanthomonadales bacterium]